MEEQVTRVERKLSAQRSGLIIGQKMLKSSLLDDQGIMRVTVVGMGVA